jgi:hypothetical protein
MYLRSVETVCGMAAHTSPIVIFMLNSYNTFPIPGFQSFLMVSVEFYGSVTMSEVRTGLNNGRVPILDESEPIPTI